jgi:molybdate transport system substrate-binding protein
MTTTLTRRLLASWLCLGLVGAAACGDDGGDDASTRTTGATASDLDGSITVFAAASLTDAFGEAGDAFTEAHPGVTVELNLAGSQALREQILAGAPADVFAAANTSNMDQVVDAGAADEPEVFARNSLEIAVPAGNPADVGGLDAFGDADLLIGLCAAEVPCGDFGREVLAAAGVTPAPDTEEPDVRSLLTKVAAGELDAGIVYRSDVLAAGVEVEGIEIPADVNVVADYPVATLTGSGEPEVAAAFVEFLLSDDGQAILESWGFDPA